MQPNNEDEHHLGSKLLFRGLPFLSNIFGWKYVCYVFTIIEY
jgi:hypothetical protein